MANRNVTSRSLHQAYRKANRASSCRRPRRRPTEIAGFTSGGEKITRLIMLLPGRFATEAHWNREERQLSGVHSEERETERGEKEWMEEERELRKRRKK